MKKIVASLVCCSVLSLFLLAEPAFAAVDSTLTGDSSRLYPLLALIVVCALTLAASYQRRK